MSLSTTHLELTKELPDSEGTLICPECRGYRCHICGEQATVNDEVCDMRGGREYLWHYLCLTHQSEYTRTVDDEA